MDIWAFLIIVIILIVGLVLSLSYIIFRLINRKNYDKRLRLFALLPILVFGYFIFTAFFPLDEFYEEDFKEVTGIDFPKTGRIINKSATFPDQFGDYSSEFIVKVDMDFFKRLPQQLLEIGFIDNTLNENTDRFNLQLLDKNELKIIKEFERTGNGVIYYVGFYSDNETLKVIRSSW